MPAASLYPFEGEELTIGQIMSKYLPKAKRGIVMYAVRTYGVDSVRAFREYLSRPAVQTTAPDNEFRRQVDEGVAAAKEAKGRPALDRRVGRASERVTGRIGCNWCGLQKPLGQTRVVPRGKTAPGRMCDDCFERRKTNLRKQQ